MKRGAQKFSPGRGGGWLSRLQGRREGSPFRPGQTLGSPAPGGPGAAPRCPEVEIFDAQGQTQGQSGQTLMGGGAQVALEVKMFDFP